MSSKTQSPAKKDPLSGAKAPDIYSGREAPGQGRRGSWFAGMIAGQLLGFMAAMLVVAPLPVLFVSILTGGVLGVLAEAKVKSLLSRRQPANDNPRRLHVFEALERGDSKLAEMLIEEDFNGAASSDSRGNTQKQKPQPRLAPAAVAPPMPKMGRF